LIVDYQNPDIIASVLACARTVAVVGLSANPDRPSHEVATYLQSQGYKIIPVNPTIETALGEKAYPDLASVPGHIDVVDIFRKGEDVGPIVEEAIVKGAGTIWMQLGVVNEEAAKRASEAGLNVIMDRCMKHEHKKIHG